jgi:tetratricopeptide (TPR) repeat protein
LRDVLSVQAEVATSIARAVRVALTPTEQGRLAQRRPVDPAVYDIYLQGRHAWNHRTPAGLQDAIRYFEQALKKDPDFALAHAGLADTYSLLGTAGYTTQTVPDGMVRAKASAERALALDDSLAEGHTSLGRVLYYYEWDWPAAEHAYRRALDLNRGYATAHQWYATLLSEQGRDQEAISEAQRAVALDPQSAIMHMTLGSIHYNGRRYELAVACEQRALELDLNALAPRLILAGSFMAQGNARAAIEVCERAPSPLHPLILATLSSAYSRAGDSKRASEFRQQLLARPDLTAAALLRLHAGSGDKEAFFPALERAINERSDIIPRLKVSPLFDSVRTDGRFASFLNRLRLS